MDLDVDPVAALGEAVAAVTASLVEIAAILPSLRVEEVDAVLGQYNMLVRIGTVGVALAARRGVALEAHTVFGHRSAADWVATRCGAPHARAKDTLQLDESLSKSAPVHEAFMRGELSPAEGRILANTVSVVPGCGPELLRVRREGSLRELDQHATRVRQRAWSREHQKQRRARAYRRRSLRFVQLPEGGVRVQVLLTEEAWVKVLGPLEQRAGLLFRRARRAKEVGTREQYLADALVDLVSGPTTESTGATTVVHGVRVDAAALRRGSLEPGEICEIPGVGPVSVEAARQLIGDGIFQILVRDGVDVTTITGHHHFVPRRLQAALQERDPICVVPECDADIGLQIHHWEVDAAFGGPTRIENLCRICPVHHDLATHGGWKLRGGAGHWEWIAPAWPVSERLRQQRRRVVAGRAGRARRRPD